MACMRADLLRCVTILVAPATGRAEPVLESRLTPVEGGLEYAVGLFGNVVLQRLAAEG